MWDVGCGVWDINVIACRCAMGDENARRGMWDVGCGMWSVGCAIYMSCHVGLQCGMQIHRTCGMWDVGCGMWDVGNGMWDVGHQDLGDVRCGMWNKPSRHHGM